MKMHLHIEMNNALFLRNPENSDLGKNIIKHSILLIHQMGFEAFTFKKLAIEIGTTEAGVYRYFENKHKLLLYLTSWYWGWIEFQVKFQTNNIVDPFVKLSKVVHILSSTILDDEHTSYVNENILHKIVIDEGSKAFLTKHVDEDNLNKFFKTYKDLCEHIGTIVLECNKDYPYPRSLGSTIIETAHIQHYFMNHLPSLTDFGIEKNETKIEDYLNDLILRTLTPLH